MSSTTSILTPCPLLNEKQASEYLQFTPRALQKWRLDGSGPKFVKISGRAVRYRKIDLDDWIENRIRRSTSDPGQHTEV